LLETAAFTIGTTLKERAEEIFIGEYDDAVALTDEAGGFADDTTAIFTDGATEEPAAGLTDEGVDGVEGELAAAPAFMQSVPVHFL
jgi:hypothetical protein